MPQTVKENKTQQGLLDLVCRMPVTLRKTGTRLQILPWNTGAMLKWVTGRAQYECGGPREPGEHFYGIESGKF